MVFKHGLIPLEVHSWITANLALTLCRDADSSPESQRQAWFLGLFHDAGVLSLREGFDHTNVGVSEVRLLLRMIEEKYHVQVRPPIGEDLLVEFAHLHANSHRRSQRVQALGELKQLFNGDAVDYVVKADSISTGREKLGFQRDIPRVLRSYTTGYIFDTPFRRHNIVCFLEHANRMEMFENLLKSEADSIREEVGVACYDPIVTKSTWAIEYHLSERDYARLSGRFEDSLKDRQKFDTIVVETRQGPRAIKNRQKNATINARCILCGSPGRFYKGVGDPPEVREHKKELKRQGVEGPESKINTGKGNVSRVLGFELDTWRGEFNGGKVRYQDQRRGLCEDCAAAINNNHPTLDGVIIFIPRSEDINLYADDLNQRRLIKWKEWSDKGLCSPDPDFFDLEYWKNTKDYSEVLEGLDERRAKYEKALEIYEENISVFEAEDRGVYGSAPLSDELLESLASGRFTLAPMAYGCVKPSVGERVVVNGFSFEREVAAVVLKLVKSGVQLDPAADLMVNLEQIVGRVEGLSTSDLDLVVSNYECVVGAVSV